MEYNVSVREPWFSLIKDGIKTVEGRINRRNFAEMKVGDIIMFENNDIDEQTRTVKTKITLINKYHTFEDMIRTEGISNVLPNQQINTIDDAVKIYRQWYSINDEKVGVIGIHLKVVSNC